VSGILDSISVLLADDHSILRDGLAALLETQEGISGAGHARLSMYSTTEHIFRALQAGRQGLSSQGVRGRRTGVRGSNGPCRAALS
jgi:hypothetical protein